MSDTLRVTPLYDLHLELGAKMVPFAGYDMPVQYPLGVMKEHLHTRAKAGLFDVSHMGQVIVRHPDGYAGAALALEALVPVNLLGLGEKRQRYAMFTNDQGGIEDDLMITRRGDELLVVVNAACKAADIAHMQHHMTGCDVVEVADRALIALQGPSAEAALEPVAPGCDIMKFLDTGIFTSEYGELWISRSGYTGEDGYEISVHATHADALCRRLLEHEDVEPIGLGARDSLRLEAGLCLYGNDIDTTTSPVEAGLSWAIQRVRRTGGDRAGGFPGAERILNELANGTQNLRVGLRPEGRAPMREGTQLFANAEGGAAIGQVTSGAFGPTIEGPMSMGYVEAAFTREGTQIFGEVRGKRQPVRIAAMPFTPNTFKR
ncbi:MAG: glycine cleavage system aminomethyltransferase GcvT [Roseovarius sp.]